MSGSTAITAMLGFLVLVMLPLPAYSQTGSTSEPVRYVGGESIDPTPHDGRLRPAIGVSTFQVLRANRTKPERAEDFGWTYNHAPALCYWNETFYLEYLSNPVDEHIAPGHTLVATSKDGREWAKPIVAFPAYTPPPGVTIPAGYDGYMMHQRMGFYVAPNGRLLVLAFYGHTEDPFLKGGIGRVVREAYKDGTYGPIYFIRYTRYAEWNESNTSYPLFTRSDDKGFVEACESLLANRLMTLQWRDEDPDPVDDPVEGDVEALSFYHRPDGKVVGLWKWSMAALSEDEGNTFSKPVKLPTITMDGAKIWGQRTPDGRYALVYNPTLYSEHRYPLGIVTGDDGVLFDNLLLVNGEVPPRRFFGRWKDYGQQYTRGIEEGNGTPPGAAFWVAYSMNKEDIWVSRIPTPVRSSVDSAIDDGFNDVPPGECPNNWNVYSPKWAPVKVVDGPSKGSRSLELRDEDPYDYARAVRVFREGTRVTIATRIRAESVGKGMLNIEVMDRYGNRPVRIAFAEDGQLKATRGVEEVNVFAYVPNQWHEIVLVINAGLGGDAGYDLSVDGTSLLQNAPLAEAVKSVERISFRTGPHRDVPTRQTLNETPHDPLPGADDPVPAAVFHIGNLKVSP